MNQRNLPLPDQAALEHSAKVCEHIRQEIHHHGESISFARFMELALYAPGLGYYSAGQKKFGRQGDFVTAPEISPLFAKCLARQCQEIFNEMADATILEMGPGSGILACELLLELERLDCLPTHYYLLEVSADLRARQRELFEERCPHLLTKVIWLDKLPEKISGVIVANEVLDAMPVHCFRVEASEIKERCVTWRDEKFSWEISETSNPDLILCLKNLNLADDYESEINLSAIRWIKTLADILEKGLVLLLDYGFGESEFYHPDRHRGTLMCHYQHHAHDDPFFLPGLQDITAHVNFTAIAEAAHVLNCSLSGYTTQSSFLLGCGLTEIASAEKNLSDAEQFRMNQAIKMLTLPHEMGELFKVMALTKCFDLPLRGFQFFDRRRDL